MVQKSIYINVFMHHSASKLAVKKSQGAFDKAVIFSAL